MSDLQARLQTVRGRIHDIEGRAVMAEIGADAGWWSLLSELWLEERRLADEISENANG